MRGNGFYEEVAAEQRFKALPYLRGTYRTGDREKKREREKKRKREKERYRE